MFGWQKLRVQAHFFLGSCISTLLIFSLLVKTGCNQDCVLSSTLGIKKPTLDFDNSLLRGDAARNLNICCTLFSCV